MSVSIQIIMVITQLCMSDEASSDAIKKSATCNRIMIACVSANLEKQVIKNEAKIVSDCYTGLVEDLL